MISLDLLRRYSRWGVAACGVLILVLSLLPDVPKHGPRGADKIEHILAYFVLGALGAVAVSPGVRAWLPWTLTVVVIAAYGGLIEILQGFVGRNADLWDLAGDAAGAIGGTLTAAGLLLVLRRVGARERSGIKPDERVRRSSRSRGRRQCTP